MRMLETLQHFFDRAASLIRRVVGVMQTVEIDAPRGAILCVALQLVVVLLLVVAFRAEGTHVARPQAVIQEPTRLPSETDGSNEAAPLTPTESSSTP